MEKLTPNPKDLDPIETASRDEIEALLGYAPRTALVHRDDMVVGR